MGVEGVGRVGEVEGIVIVKVLSFERINGVWGIIIWVVFV